MIKESRWWKKIYTTRTFPTTTWLGTPGTKTLITRKDTGEWIGHIVHGRAGKGSFVDNSGVTLQAQGKGLGKFLYSKAAYDAKTQGAKFLSSDPQHLTSADAEKVWRRLGKKYPMREFSNNNNPKFVVNLSKEAASRYFVAADLPRNVKERIDAPAANIPVDRKHMTLLYLGKHNASEEPFMRSIVKYVSKRHKDVSLKPKGAIQLGRKGKVLAVETTAPNRFKHLRKDLEEVSGQYSQYRDFKPHITLNYHAPHTAKDIKGFTVDRIPVKSIGLYKVGPKGEFLELAKSRLRKRNIFDRVRDRIEEII